MSEKFFSMGKNLEMLFILTHALRTLIKEGDTEVLELLGYRENPNILLKDFKLINSDVKVGESLEFLFTIGAKRERIVNY